MKNALVVCLLAAVFCSSTASIAEKAGATAKVTTDPCDCKAIEAALKQEIAKKQAVAREQIDQKVADISQRAQAIKDDAAHHEGAIVVDVDVSMKDQVFIFGLPTVTMKDQKFVFGMPEMKLTQQHVIFDLPAFRKVDKKIGQSPDFTLHGVELTVGWHDNIVTVVEPYMERQDIVMGIPEFSVRDQTIIIGIPEFSMQEQRIVIGLPEIKVNDLELMPNQTQQQQGNALSRESDTFANTMTAKLQKDIADSAVTKIHQMFKCKRDQLQKQKQLSLQTIDATIAAYKAALEQIKTTGVAQKIEQAQKALNSVIKQRGVVSAEFDKALTQLDAAERDTVKKILGQTSPQKS